MPVLSNAEGNPTRPACPSGSGSASQQEGGEAQSAPNLRSTCPSGSVAVLLLNAMMERARSTAERQTISQNGAAVPAPRFAASPQKKINPPNHQTPNLPAPNPSKTRYEKPIDRTSETLDRPHGSKFCPLALGSPSPHVPLPAPGRGPVWARLRSS